MPESPQNAVALRVLHAALEAASREAAASRAVLDAAAGRFTAVSYEVIAVVGGSAQQVDQQMVQALREAAHHTNRASAALVMAESSARIIR